jgi:hypothetical protein
MDISNIQFPDGMLSPEEQARFDAFQQKYTAYYAEHGEEMDWTNTAIELGIIEVEELTPDQQQYLQSVYEIMDELEACELENFAAMKAAQQKHELFRYFVKEVNWIRDIIARKQIEANQRMLDPLKIYLEDCKAHKAAHPDDPNVDRIIAKVTKAVEALTTQITVQQLKLAAKDEVSQN